LRNRNSLDRCFGFVAFARPDGCVLFGRKTHDRVGARIGDVKGGLKT
jgi:hypothetical protein